MDEKKETLVAVRFAPQTIERIDKLDEILDVGRSEIIRELLPDADLISALAESGEALSTDAIKIYKKIVETGLRNYMARDPLWPLDESELNCFGQQLYQKFVDWLKASSCLYEDEGYKLFPIKQNGKETGTYKLKTPPKALRLPKFAKYDPVGDLSKHYGCSRERIEKLLAELEKNKTGHINQGE
jgi:hypothetical protein